MCPEFNEIYSFNTFGTLESASANVGSCDNWVEVDFISFVSTDMKVCEVLYNDSKAMVYKSLFDCTSFIRKYGNYLGTMFTISHEDSIGKFNQVFFVAHKGVIRKSILERGLAIKEWKNLSK